MHYVTQTRTKSSRQNHMGYLLSALSKVLKTAVD